MHDVTPQRARWQPPAGGCLVAQQRRPLWREVACLAALILAAVIPLLIAATTVPAVAYAPDSQAATASAPEQAVIQLLRDTRHMPPPDTRIDAPGAGLVTGVAVTQVRARSSQTLLRSVLDTAPTITAEVDVTVVVDGYRRIELTFELSQYGMLLPGAPPAFNGAWTLGTVRWRGERADARGSRLLSRAPRGDGYFFCRPETARDASNAAAMTNPATAPAISAPVVPSSGLTSPSTCCAIRMPT